MSESQHKPNRFALRQGRVSMPNLAYFITKCALEPVGSALARDDCAQMVVDSFLWARDNRWWRLLGFVVMPGHYHLAIALYDGKTLSDAIGGVDKYTSRRINQVLGHEGAFWEEGFYDHAIRNRSDFDAILTYIHSNPVEAGLALLPETWPYSTASLKHAPQIDWEWLGPSLPNAVHTKRRFSPSEMPARYR